jgi:hypothetical protein
MKLDLLTNATVVKDAMRSEHNNKKEEVKEKDICSVASVAKEETTTNQFFE